MKDAAYWAWIAEEAKAMKSDGCTAATDWHVECCWEHDLACEYGRDPEDAYRIHLAGGANVWAYAAKLSRRKADKRFKSCNMKRSGPVGDVRSFFRYLGVRIGAFLPPY